MIYDVHRFDINMEKDQDKLKQFLNNLRGEVVAIIPNVKPTFKPMGATAKIDFLYIIEKLWVTSLSLSVSIKNKSGKNQEQQI